MNNHILNFSICTGYSLAKRQRSSSFFCKTDVFSKLEISDSQTEQLELIDSQNNNQSPVLRVEPMDYPWSCEEHP